jgi:hypothetical protein
MSWLRRQKHEPEPPAEEPTTPAAAPYVPASMRPRPITVPPSMQDDDVDRDDGQIAFLASLAQEVDRERAPDAPGMPAASATRTDGDALWAFRDAAPAFDPYDGGGSDRRPPR